MALGQARCPYHEPTVRELVQAARDVARELGKLTSHETIFEYADPRLLINFAHRAGTTTVTLRPANGSPVGVLSVLAETHSPELLRPGRWCDYLVGTLLPRAREARERREAQERAQRDADLKARFGAVDDAALFPELDPPESDAAPLAGVAG